jgi:hypothetical protein
MALYTFTQPTAATNFVFNSLGTSASDEYRITINPNANILPFGTWIINDTSNAALHDQLVLDLFLSPSGEYLGPIPGFVQYQDTGRFIATFVDARSNPLRIEFNGFNQNDSIRGDIRNAQGQLVETINFNSWNFSTGKSAGGIHDFAYSFEQNSGQTIWAYDVSRVTPELQQSIANLSRASEYEFTFAKNAFSNGGSLALSDSLNNGYENTFNLSAAATNNQTILLTQVSGDPEVDEVSYIDRGLQANGLPGYVSDANQLADPLEFRYFRDEVQISRTVRSNTNSSTEYIDRFVGIDSFNLTERSDQIFIDVSSFQTNSAQGRWGDWRTLNVRAYEGNDVITFYRDVANTTQTILPEGFRNVELGSVFLRVAEPYNPGIERNAVFLNLTGESQRARNTSGTADISLASSVTYSGGGNRAEGWVLDAYGSYDQIIFEQNAEIKQLGFEGSIFSDRFYLGDEGLGGLIQQYFLTASRGNDIYRSTNENIEVLGKTSSMYFSYAWVHDDIDDGNLNQVPPIAVKYYSGVVQKGDRGIYGVDQFQAEVEAALKHEQYQLSDADNYVEQVVKVDAETLEFNLRYGADRVYLKPLLNDLNREMIVRLNEGSSGDSFVRSTNDLVEIDFKGILEQADQQVGSTNTTIRLSGLEAIDRISFVNPSTGGMTRTAYDDGNSGTSNDAQMGWTFTRTQTSGSNTYTHKVNVLIEDSSITALQANPITVNARTVYDYPTYAMTANADNAILFEDSGLNTFYDFQAGNDFVLLRDGNLDVVLGAGDDFAGVSGNVGEAIVIGGTGNDTIGLQGRIGTNGGASDWVFTTMDVATARTVFAEKYALNPAANPFQIELSASGMEVVTVAQRYEGGTTWNLVTKKYTGVGDVVQTVYLQAENVSSADSGEVTVDSLYGSRDFSATASVAGTFSYLGRRGTEDSLTITLSDANSLATAMSNINAWFVTTNGTLASLNGSVLNGSHLSTITTGAMGVTGLTGATYNLVDIEQITLRGGAESVTIRLAGANGYGSVSEAVSAADYKDVIFVAKTIESPGFANPNLLNSIANQTTIDIPAGLGIVFEPVTASTTYRVNITDQMVADAPMNADRLVYLLGRQNVDVNGSVLSDMIIGNQGNNIIYGAGGNDVIYGGGGNDTMFGQAGNDLLIGSAGNDFLNGGTGDDTLMTYGSKRTNATTADRTNMIGGSGDDDFIFLGGQGNHVMYGGSGDDGYKIMPGWENGLNRVGTTAQQRDINGVGNVLDYSTTADFIVGRSLGTGSAENYLTSVNLTFNQLVSPPNPIGSSYVATTFTNGTTMQANADNFTISSQTNLGSLLEDYGLMNDVTEYRLHQAA